MIEAREKAAAEDYAGISAYLPRNDGANDEVFRYQEQETKEYFAELWTKVKAAN